MFEIDKSLIIKGDKFYEEDGETDQIRELTEREYIRKYKKNLMENCIVNIKGNLRKVKDEYYPEKAEIIWTKKELKRLLKNQLLENGKEIIVYYDGLLRTIVVLNERREFIKMLQMEYGSTKGKRKVDALMEMAEEGIFILRECYQNEVWFKID